MKAMVLDRIGSPLSERDLAEPEPGRGEIRVRIRACAVCRTDLHVADGELPAPKVPLVLGHEAVGTIDRCGESVDGLAVGDRVGIPWLAWTCGECRPCRRGRENLCDRALFHGYTRDGGFAELLVADARYAFRLPEGDDSSLAPLLCAGLIGFRSYRMCGEEFETLGLYGFGAAAHIVAQVALADGKRVYAFTRPGDRKGQEFAQRMGVAWAGGSDEPPPEPLDAAILFAPVGSLLPAALRASAKGATIVCGGIHMSDIPSFPYRLLWEERKVVSVANLTRRDGIEFFERAAALRIRTEIERFPLSAANRAMGRLRAGDIEGAAVLEVG